MSRRQGSPRARSDRRRFPARSPSGSARRATVAAPEASFPAKPRATPDSPPPYPLRRRRRKRDPNRCPGGDRLWRATRTARWPATRGYAARAAARRVESVSRRRKSRKGPCGFQGPSWIFPANVPGCRPGPFRFRTCGDAGGTVAAACPESRIPKRRGARRAFPKTRSADRTRARSAALAERGFPPPASIGRFPVRIR